MPKMKTNDIATYYESHGNGPAIVFIHGGWADNRMWQPQVTHFSAGARVIVYDVRGHGRTGGSAEKKYSLGLFAADLATLVRGLGLDRPVICGLSMGGMIAQEFATCYPAQLRALILADTAISSALTPADKIIKYLLAPKWLFLLIVRLLGTKRYADFAFWYAKKTRGEQWVKNREFIEYEKELMRRFSIAEFNKIFAALYDFKLTDLERIKVPTLILNGEFESKAVFTHTRRAKQLIPQARDLVVPGAGHASNYENASFFNQAVAQFLKEAGFYT